MTTLAGIAIGYSFAVVVGHFAIQRVVDSLWRAIGWMPSAYDERPEYYQPRLVGIIERTLYVASLQMGEPEFIGVWLALKVAGQWKRWGEEATIAGRKVEGRVFYNIFLIGSGLSVAYAVGGAQMIGYFQRSRLLYFAILPLAILVGTEILQVLARRWADKSKKDTANNQVEVTR